MLTFAGEMQGVTMRAQASMMGAVACAQVPKLTVIMGNSIGPANFYMVSISLFNVMVHTKYIR